MLGDDGTDFKKNVPTKVAVCEAGEKKESGFRRAKLGYPSSKPMTKTKCRRALPPPRGPMSGVLVSGL